MIIALIAMGDVVFFVINKQPGVAFISLFTVFSLFLLPVWVFRNCLRVYAWLLLPVILLVPLDVGYIVFYNVPIDDSMLLLALNTNSAEVTELAKSYASAIVPMLVACYGLYFIAVKRTSNVIPRKQATVISICALCFLAIVPLFNGSSESWFQRLRSRLYTVYPTSIAYGLGVVYEQYHLMSSTEAIRSAFRFHAAQQAVIRQKQVYILVLGESARYDHFGINGYYRNTTPKLGKESNLINFADMKTGGYITEYSIPLILTGVGADNFKKHCLQKSIVSAFKEAGFSTYWISNQTDNGHIKLHITEAQHQYLMQSDYRATKNTHTDSELLAALNQVLAQPDNKKFIVLHRLGSHYDYASRYPDSVDYFKPSNKTVFTAANDFNHRNVIINSYDNSIRYTDIVLDSIINLSKKQNAVSSVYYISDHGENLFDDSRHLSQHGYPVPSKYIAHVPFFIWYSDALKKLRTDKIANLQAHRGSKASTQDIIYTYTDMCGINFTGYDSRKSLSSPDFTNTPQKIVSGGFKVLDCNSLQ
ncbi:sulfatase-like hydrolase/transferase [Mucilaginibacter sp. AW1-3]